MSKTDVADLAREDLPSATFPAPREEAFRFYMAPEVHRGIGAHAKIDQRVEICGVLVGLWARDESGPFAVATAYIRSTSAASKFAEVTFTHESWAEINREMDAKYADKRIIGWYHTHPDFGIFLSERDCFIHEHFFANPGQVAYVVDPVRDLEGVFTWQNGKPAPMSHFWVGPQIHTVQKAVRNEANDGAGRTSAAPTAQLADVLQSPPPPQSSLGTAATLLAWTCLFLLGYSWAGIRTRAEEQQIIERAVAHFGQMKVMKIGLEVDLLQLRAKLKDIETKLGKLPNATDKLAPEEAAQADKLRQAIGDDLVLVERKLDAIQQDYALTRDELLIYLEKFGATKEELRKLLNGPLPDVVSPPATGSSAPDAAGGSATTNSENPAAASSTNNPPPASGSGSTGALAPILDDDPPEAEKE